jgi:hypothetical protein
MDSYDLGQFPPLWREWNGKYRDTMRDFWRSHPVGIGEFADRFAGSSDLYSTAGRRPTSSVNLITVHDGFTLRNLVSYNDKHNEANGEHKPRRDQRQQFLELRRRRPRRRPRCAGAARPPVQGPCPPYLMPHASSRHVYRVRCRGWSGCCSACRRPCRAALAPALQVRPIRRFGVALMRMSGDGDDERLIP